MARFGGVSTIKKVLDSEGNLIVDAVTGIEFVRFMQNTINGGTPNGDDEIYNSATGCKYFEARLDPADVLAVGESIVLAWSTTVSDTDADANAEAAADELNGTPLGIPYNNIAVLNSLFDSVELIWDGVSTIKRVVAVSTDATQYNYLLRVVE